MLEDQTIRFGKNNGQGKGGLAADRKDKQGGEVEGYDPLAGG